MTVVGAEGGPANLMSPGDGKRRPAHRRRGRKRNVRTIVLTAVITVLAASTSLSLAFEPKSVGAHSRLSSPAPHPEILPSVKNSTTSTTDLLGTNSIAEYLAGRTGNITAAVYDVRTGALSLWRPGVAEDTASIIKVDILATLLHQDQGVGTAITSEQSETATSMIEASDNDSATDLWNEDGMASGIASYDSLLGLSGTVPGSDGDWGLTQTTAADQITLLRSVFLPSSVLTAASQSYEAGLMENIDPGENWGITAGIPAGVTVAVKNGWLPIGTNNWQINSIGSVDGAGRDYLIAVLSNGQPTEEYGIETIEGLSSLVWADGG